MVYANVRLFTHREHLLPVCVAAQLSHHRYSRTQTRRLNGLICAFSSGRFMETCTQHGLSFTRKNLCGGYLIHDEASNN
jgi:hypothetical protein